MKVELPTTCEITSTSDGGHYISQGSSRDRDWLRFKATLSWVHARRARKDEQSPESVQNELNALRTIVWFQTRPDDWVTGPIDIESWASLSIAKSVKRSPKQRYGHFRDLF